MHFICLSCGSFCKGSEEQLQNNLCEKCEEVQADEKVSSAPVT